MIFPTLKDLPMDDARVPSRRGLLAGAAGLAGAAALHPPESGGQAEADERVNPAGIKGIGEIGIVGMNAAVANAVFNVTGKRIRDLPIRAEVLI